MKPFLVLMASCFSLLANGQNLLPNMTRASIYTGISQHSFPNLSKWLVQEKLPDFSHFNVNYGFNGHVALNKLCLGGSGNMGMAYGEATEVLKATYGSGGGQLELGTYLTKGKKHMALMLIGLGYQAQRMTFTRTANQTEPRHPLQGEQLENHQFVISPSLVYDLYLGKNNKPGMLLGCFFNTSIVAAQSGWQSPALAFWHSSIEQTAYLTFKAGIHFGIGTLHTH